MKLFTYKKLAIFSVVIITASFLFTNFASTTSLNKKRLIFWPMQSIDTVKYSRDPARQYLEDPSFDETIEEQVSLIAATGANYIALGTPYDPEFIPFLRRWVNISRAHGLKIWFRGNFSGWEGWFDHAGIDREEHKTLLKSFILDNGNLFEDGDIFTSCTECENGGPGDPRQTGDTKGHRQFLIDEYKIGRSAFTQIGKNVATNYFPMNGDIANLIMDRETTRELGGVVTIDHYVPSYKKMNDDVNRLAEKSGGKIVIGEFGAPIPDLHGKMTEKEQADWVDKALNLLVHNKNVIGVNYWTSFGGSTKLWNDDATEREVVTVIKKYFSPKGVIGTVIDETGKPIPNAAVETPEKSVTTNENGEFYIPFLNSEPEIKASAEGYISRKLVDANTNESITITLQKQKESVLFKLRKFVYKYFKI